jgi:hypothetical protein
LYKKKPRRKCNKFWISRDEHQGDLHELWIKERIIKDEIGEGLE